jgi:hypothetical protein
MVSFCCLLKVEFQFCVLQLLVSSSASLRLLQVRSAKQCQQFYGHECKGTAARGGHEKEGLKGEARWVSPSSVIQHFEKLGVAKWSWLIRKTCIVCRLWRLPKLHNVLLASLLGVWSVQHSRLREKVLQPRRI